LLIKNIIGAIELILQRFYKVNFKLNSIRIHTARFFTFIVALQMLNLCIDTQSFQFLHSKQTVGYSNEINSFVEYFAEVVFDHKNALPEYQKSSHDNQQVHKHFGINHLAVEDRKTFEHPCAQSGIVLSPLQKGYDYLFFKEINPPPPKA
jgi:hypothetical protein